jgi:hypothetical protein
MVKAIVRTQKLWVITFVAKDSSAVQAGGALLRRHMLRATYGDLCCDLKYVAVGSTWAPLPGPGLPAQHNLGGLDPLEEPEQRGSCDSRPGLALRRPKRSSTASLEFLAGLGYHGRRVERLVVELQRDSRGGKPAENMLRSRLSDRNRRLPHGPRSAGERSDALGAPEPIRNIVLSAT